MEWNIHLWHCDKWFTCNLVSLFVWLTRQLQWAEDPVINNTTVECKCLQSTLVYFVYLAFSKINWYFFSSVNIDAPFQMNKESVCHSNCGLFAYFLLILKCEVYNIGHFVSHFCRFHLIQIMVLTIIMFQIHWLPHAGCRSR